MSLPVMARGVVCDHCGSSNLEVYDDERSYVSRNEECIHGYVGSEDRVDYIIHKDKLYCIDCRQRMVSPNEYWEEMRRMCQWARSVLTVGEGVLR